MRRTWDDAAAVLADLAAQLRARFPGREVVALGVTGQGDGTWLIDADGEPVGRRLAVARRARRRHRGRTERQRRGAAVFAYTGTGLAACQQAPQLLWMQRHRPEALARAATALHPKDYLYFRLTGATRHLAVRGQFHLRRLPHARSTGRRCLPRSD